LMTTVPCQKKSFSRGTRCPWVFDIGTWSDRLKRTFQFLKGRSRPDGSGKCRATEESGRADGVANLTTLHILGTSRATTGGSTFVFRFEGPLSNLSNYLSWSSINLNALLKPLPIN
jgi:hypothetical protein